MNLISGRFQFDHGGVIFLPQRIHVKTYSLYNSKRFFLPMLAQWEVFCGMGGKVMERELNFGMVTTVYS